MAIRKGASLELSHVLLLADDPTDRLLSGLEQKKTRFPKLYDLDLMLGGGHLVGYLVSGDEAAEFSLAVADYEKSEQPSELFCTVSETETTPWQRLRPAMRI